MIRDLASSGWSERRALCKPRSNQCLSAASRHHERAKGEVSIAPLAKLPHVMFFGGGVVIKAWRRGIGSIGASGAAGAKLDDGCAYAGRDQIRDQLR